jgi:hypothetical protein
MRGVWLLLILAIVYCWPAYAESDYNSERKALYENAFLSDKDNSSTLIEMLFDKDFLVHDPCEMFREAFAENMIGANAPECDWEPEISIEGISSEGQNTLIAAAETYDSFRLDTLNERARLFVAFCETGEIDPNIVAGNVSDIHDTIFQWTLQFYQATISELSEQDVELLERHNLEAFGIERPVVGDTVRKIEAALASRFPEEYRKEHLNNCIEAVENKDLSFKRFRREPYREDCSRTTNTFGPNGETVSSTMLSMAPGCATIEYYAQKPEMVGDKVIEDN